MWKQCSNGLMVHQLSLTSSLLSPVQGDHRSVLERVKSLYRSMKVKKADWEKENERRELQRAAGVLCVQAAGRSQCCSSQMVLWDKLCWHCRSPVYHGHYLSASQPVWCPPLHLPTLDFSFCLFLFLNLLSVYLAQCNCSGFSDLSLNDEILWLSWYCKSSRSYGWLHF